MLTYQTEGEEGGKESGLDRLGFLIAHQDHHERDGLTPREAIDAAHFDLHRLGLTSLKRTWEIICGDCLDVLPALDQVPRLIFADPPYNQGVNYGNGGADDLLPPEEYRQWLRCWISPCADLLADDGSLWVMMPQEHQASAFLSLEAAGLHWRNTITWHETFGVNCARKFCRTSRPIHYFVKQPTRFVFNSGAVRVPSDRQLKYGDKRANPDGKVPGDVWEISRVCGTFGERIADFPTQLPVELLRRIITVASDPGDLVLDPFSGSATTGVAAVESGRRYLGIEKNAAYCDMSRSRLETQRTLWS